MGKDMGAIVQSEGAVLRAEEDMGEKVGTRCQCRKRGCLAGTARPGVAMCSSTRAMVGGIGLLTLTMSSPDQAEGSEGEENIDEAEGSEGEEENKDDIYGAKGSEEEEEEDDDDDEMTMEEYNKMLAELAEVIRAKQSEEKR